MVVLQSDEPADELWRVCRELGLTAYGEPAFTEGHEATGRDFRRVALGVHGRCVILVSEELHWRVPDPLLEGAQLGLVFFASENWGGTNHIRIFEGGRHTATWEEEGTQDQDHPLLQGLPEGLHPFDRIQQIAERVLGDKPLDVLDRPMIVGDGLD
jgi:hypothetical protein